MRLTKRQLKKIIREEKQKLIKESSMEQSYQYAEQLLHDAVAELVDNFTGDQLSAAADDAERAGSIALHEMLRTAAEMAGEFYGEKYR